MNNHSKYNQGRPTKEEQEAISKELQQYYEKGCSATFTSKETRINIKTVLKYFEEWDKELLESTDNDFLQRCKIEKERSVIALESEIESLKKEEEEVEQLKQASIKSGDVLKFERFSKLKLKIKELKAKLLSEKINLVNTPTMDTIMKFQSGDDKQ